MHYLYIIYYFPYVTCCAATRQYDELMGDLA